MHLFRALTLSFIFSLFGISAFAETAGEPLRTPKQKTDNYVRVASMLVREAKEMQKMSPSSKVVHATISLYTSAGQLFELAAKDYRTLVPQKKATEEEVNAALNGMRFCVGSVRQVKEGLTQAGTRP